jgi:hypothetical protein
MKPGLFEYRTDEQGISNIDRSSSVTSTFEIPCSSVRYSKGRSGGTAFIFLGKCNGSIHASSSEQQGEDEEYDENEEKHFCDACCTGSNTAEPEDSSYDGYNEKDNCPA